MQHWCSNGATSHLCVGATSTKWSWELVWLSISTGCLSLSYFVEDHQCDWDSNLPLLLMAYRTAIHESTGCTPASLMLGRDSRLPIDLLYGRPDQEPPRSTLVYSENLEVRLEQIQEFARDNLKITRDRMKERYDLSVDNTLLERGDPVWLYTLKGRRD